MRYLPRDSGRGTIRFASIYVLLALLPVAGGVDAAEPAIRVRVVEGVASVRIAGEGLRVDGRSLRGAATRATAGPDGILVDGTWRRGLVSVEGRGGVLVDGEWYDGRVALIPRDAERLDVVNVLPLERYVAGSVAAEVYPSWPVEVLKAQAVIARSYALHERGRRNGEAFDLEAGVLSQSYRSGEVSRRVREASRATRGIWLSFAGKPILAAYHSSAGGRTASAREVWGEELPYLRVLESPDHDAPDYFWSFEIEEGDLARALGEHGVAVRGVPRVEIAERSESGRVLRLRVGEAVIEGRDLRQILGGAAIKSTLFEVRTRGEQVLFLGSGSGHGVGLSQWGALALARQGRSFEEILAYYYPGSVLERGLARGAAVLVERSP